jgi:sugar-specific transcriptional regulator TrmB
MDLAKELKQRIEETKSLLDSAKNAAAKAKAEEDILANDLTAYQRTLNAELRRSGHVELSEVPQSTRNFEGSAAARGDDEVNKARFMRELIVGSRATGTTPSTIMEALKNKGAECPPTYVYSALSRMKKKGLVVVRRGKYFPSNALSASNGAAGAASE